MERFHWSDYVCKPILLRVGFEEVRVFAEYKEKGGNELYEIYVGGHGYSASQEEVEFLIVNMMSTSIKKNTDYVWLGVFADQNLAYPRSNKDCKRLRRIAKKVVEKGMKINYENLELTLLKNLNILGLN